MSVRLSEEVSGGALAGPTYSRAAAGHHSFALSAEDRERLAARLAWRSGARDAAAGRCWRRISLPLGADVDPSAVVCASRRPGEQWFVFEQPDRGRAALAALGQATALQAAGAERFATVADRWRALSAAAVAASSPDGPPMCPRAPGRWRWAASRSRPTAAPRRTGRGFEPASLTVPEVALVRSERGGELNVADDADGARSPG